MSRNLYQIHQTLLAATLGIAATFAIAAIAAFAAPLAAAEQPAPRYIDEPVSGEVVWE